MAKIRPVTRTRAQAATVVGGAKVTRVGAGALQASASSVSGQAERGFDATGDVQARPALVAGAASVVRQASGTVVAQPAQAVGSGSTASLIAGAGALQASAASVDGSASIVVPTPGADADYDARRSQFSVVLYEDFDDPRSVNDYRWTGNIGNDPLDQSSLPNHCRHNTTDQVSHGGCLELIRPAGSAEPPGYWRGTEPHIRADKVDPGYMGQIPARAWNPTQGGSETAQSGAFGNYGPASTGVWDGDQFWVQWQMELDPRRLAAGFNGGKIMYVTRVELSLTSQEVVTTYDAFDPPNFAMYRQGSPGINSEIPLVPHIVGPALYMAQFVPGDEVEGGADTGSNTIVNVWRQNWRAGQKDWTQIFKKLDLGIDWQNNLPKAWNAILLSIYHNNDPIATEFYQRYDEFTLSKRQPLRPKSTFSGTAMESAASNLNPGEWVIDPIAQNPQSIAYDISWQNSETYWDDIRRELHYMGKAQQGGPTRHFIYDEQTNLYRATGLNITPDPSVPSGQKAGHIWGTTFDPWTGNCYFIEQNPESSSGFPYDCERSVRVMNRAIEAGAGEANSPWSQAVQATFDLWSPGQANIYQPSIGFHPNLAGPGRPGIYGVGINQHSRLELEGGGQWIKNNVPNAAPYNNCSGGSTLYNPDRDELLICDGTSTYVSDFIIKADDVDNPAPELIPNMPMRANNNNADHGKLIIDPRDGYSFMLLESGGDRVWTSNDTGRTWVLEPFTHPFWTEGRANGILGDDKGGWSPASIPRYGVVIAPMQTVGGTAMNTMMWRPG